MLEILAVVGAILITGGLAAIPLAMLHKKDRLLSPSRPETTVKTAETVIKSAPRPK